MLGCIRRPGSKFAQACPACVHPVRHLLLQTSAPHLALRLHPEHVHTLSPQPHMPQRAGPALPHCRVLVNYGFHLSVDLSITEPELIRQSAKFRLPVS